MKYYAVIDTNVLVSAMLKWDSVPGNVLELAFSGVIVPLLNEAIVATFAPSIPATTTAEAAVGATMQIMIPCAAASFQSRSGK